MKKIIAAYAKHSTKVHLGLIAIGFVLASTILVHGLHVSAQRGPPGPPPPPPPASVTVTAPTASQTISGTFQFSATVSNGPATALNFLISVGHGTSTQAGSSNDGGTTWTLNLDTTRAADGPYTVVAEATVNGSPVDSSLVSFNINNSGGGGGGSTVTMTNPTDGETVSGTIPFVATVTTGGTVSGLVFNLGGHASPAATEGPSGTWTLSTDTTHFPDGTFQLYAEATIDGSPVSSTPINITINNGLGGGGGGGGGGSATVTITQPQGQNKGGLTECGTSVPLAATVANGTASSLSFLVTLVGGSTTNIPARDAGGGNWTATLNTTQFSIGNYELSATALVGGNPVNTSGVVSFAIARTCLTMQAPSDGATISGTVPFSASVLGTQPASVKFQLLSSGSLAPQTTYVPANFDSRSGQWTASWDSTTVPNQDYSVSALALNASNQFIPPSPSITVTLDNPLSKVFMLLPANGTTLSPNTTVLDLGAAVSGDTLPSSVNFMVSGVNTPVPGSHVSDGAPADYEGSLGISQLSPGTYTVFAEAVIGRSTLDSPSVSFTIPVPTGSIVSPLDCTQVTGPVQLTGTIDGTPDTVVFRLTSQILLDRGTRFVDLPASPDRRNPNNWTASWDTSTYPSDTYTVTMIWSKNGIEEGRTLIRLGLNQVPSCFSAPAGTTVTTMNFVSPQNNATVSGMVPITLSVSPDASKASFDIFRQNAGLPTHLDATLTNGKWEADWDTTKTSNDTYSIQPTVENDNGISFDGTPITVTVNNGASTTTTPPVVPPPFNPTFDPTATGTYSADQALASNPSIDVDLGIPSTHGPFLCTPGSLIKLPNDNNPNTDADTAVYYCGNDGKRYVFTNDKVFFSWFSDFSSVVVLDADTMANIQLGGDITYRPGSRMVKIQTDPKVYAVSRGSLLRWVSTEAAAARLYGSDWNTKIDDVSDAFFVNYHFGEAIR